MVLGVQSKESKEKKELGFEAAQNLKYSVVIDRGRIEISCLRKSGGFPSSPAAAALAEGLAHSSCTHSQDHLPPLLSWCVKTTPDFRGGGNLGCEMLIFCYSRCEFSK